MDVFKFVLSAGFILGGLFMFITAMIGVNRYKHALNRMHPAAIGDTLGILLVIVGLVIWRGFSFVSMKLLICVLFFWLASPVASHMIAQLEVETDDNMGELLEETIGEKGEV